MMLELVLMVKRRIEMASMCVGVGMLVDLRGRRWLLCHPRKMSISLDAAHVF